MMNEIRILQIPELYRAYYRPHSFHKAIDHANTVFESVKAIGGVVMFNFNMEENFPENCGLAIIPLTRKIDGINEKVGVCIAAIPEFTVSLQYETEADSSWIDNVVEIALADKVAKAAEMKIDNPQAPDLPRTAVDFFGRIERISDTFYYQADEYINKLKKQGIDSITRDILREVLSSTNIAKQRYPHVNQDVWIACLDDMIASSYMYGYNPCMMEEWQEKRDYSR